MADSFSGQATGNVALGQTIGSGILSGQQLAIGQFMRAVFSASGTSADQFNRIHAKQYAFSGGTAVNVDLSSLADILGSSFSLAAPGKVRVFAAQVLSTTDGDKVTFTPAGSNGWAALFGSGGLVVHPSTSANAGFFLAVAPNTAGYVADSTHKALVMTPATSNSFSLNLLIAGCDA
jgi:hypothetical protein